MIDPSSTTLLLRNVPAELCTIELLHEHFKKFGTLVNVQVQPIEKQAKVQFATHEEAMAAYRTPEAVLGNRFISTHFEADPHEMKPPNGPSLYDLDEMRPTPTEKPMQTNSLTVQVAPSSSSSSSSTVDIEQRKRQLIDEQRAQRAVLLGKLDTAAPESRTDILRCIENIDKTIASLEGSAPQSEARESSVQSDLQMKLDALKSEVRHLLRILSSYV